MVFSENLDFRIFPNATLEIGWSYCVGYTMVGDDVTCDKSSSVLFLSHPTFFRAVGRSLSSEGVVVIQDPMKVYVMLLFMPISGGVTLFTLHPGSDGPVLWAGSVGAPCSTRYYSVVVICLFVAALALQAVILLLMLIQSSHQQNVGFLCSFLVMYNKFKSSSVWSLVFPTIHVHRGFLEH